jgi:hypothetical protein
MKEAKFLGNLLPAHPDIIPIVKAVREKYNLHEVNPEEEPIEEIYLEDRIVPFEEFRQEIMSQILENLDSLFPENFVKTYRTAKATSEAKEFTDIDQFSEKQKPMIESFFQLMKNLMQPVYSALNAQIESITDMLYIYLLTGETEEVPSDWFGKVVTLPIMGNKTVIALAGEGTNVETLVQQLREEHKKTFGAVKVNLTDKKVSSAHYLQLKKLNKPWNFILEEYIRLEKIDLPRNKNSKRYFEIIRLAEQKLKKRIQRSEKVLNIIIRDKK